MQNFIRLCGPLPILALGTACALPLDSEPLTEEDVRSEDQSIVNGSTDFTGKSSMEMRTARLRWDGSGGPSCTGTFLDPRTVLTARHCISTDRDPSGPIPTTFKLFVSRSGAADHPVDSILPMDQDHDVALLFLAASHQVLDPRGKPLVTAIEPIEPADYEDESIFISGWGVTKNNGDGTSGLRWGRMTVHDYHVGSFRGLHDGIKLRQTAADQRGAPGDSGGPYWGFKTMPPGIIGVHQGDSPGLEAREVGTQAFAIRQWALAAISAHHGLASGAGQLHTFSSASSLNNTIVHTLGTDSANWVRQENALVQTNNASKSVVIWEDLVARSFVVNVDIQSPDNDGAGVVFHFVDSDNFAYCIANEQGGYIELRERYRGNERTFASAVWAGNWDVYRRMEVRGASGTSSYQCSLDGVTVTGRQFRLPVGAMGVIQDTNDDVRFDSFDYDGSRYTL
jgi:Trypsin